MSKDAFDPKRAVKHAVPYLRRIAKAERQTQAALLAGDITRADAWRQLRDTTQTVFEEMVTKVIVRPMVRVFVKEAMRGKAKP